MPVYNEAPTVRRAIEDVLAAEVGMDLELIVVDDGSTDGTREQLESGGWPERVRILHHDRNRGKGPAVRTALAAARGEVATIFDPDLEYEPGDLAALLPPLVESRTNAVFGVRAFDGYTSHSFLYVMGNKAVTLAANVLFNVYLRDLMTCHKAMRTDLFRSLPLRASGFTIEPEITARLLQRRERIFEVPVHYNARPSEAGKNLPAMAAVGVVGELARGRPTAPCPVPPRPPIRPPARERE